MAASTNNDSIEPVRFQRLRSLVFWLTVFGLTAALFGLAGMRPWLFDRLQPLPRFFILFWLVLILIPFLSTRIAESFWSAYQSRLERLFSFIRRKPFSSSVLIGTPSALLFWYFGIQRIDSGDILEFVMAGWQGKPFLAEHAPLETLIRCWLSELLRFWPGLEIIVLTKILVCIYGASYVIVILNFSARFTSPFARLIPLFLLISPALNVFFAYPEIYGFAILFQTVFLLTGMLFLQNRASIVAVSCFYGLSLVAGFWHGLLFPAYLYLLVRARRENRIAFQGLALHGLLVITPVLLSLVLLIPYANPFAGIITRLSEPSVVIPFSHTARAMSYGLFSKAHLADWASEIILIVFLPIGLMAGRLLTGFRIAPQGEARPVFRFLAIGACATSLFGFMYFPVLGLPLDWDLYTFMFPSVALCGVSIMSELSVFRLWRRRILVLVLAAAALSSTWILQNALFWRYPVTVARLGPVIAPFVPDFYFKKMNRAFENQSEGHLYLLADRALRESPERYREILSFMDDWTVSVLAKRPPRPFDYPGWACDLVTRDDRIFVFDIRGRIFEAKNESLHWIYAPETRTESPVVAGDFAADGAALLLCENGQILRVSPAVLETGAKEERFWGPLEIMETFLPDSPSARNMPVRLVDIAVRQDTQSVCVLDNFNRVWDVGEKRLLLEGDRSCNLAKALHFTSTNQPVTIDVNNRLSYDKEKIEFPFRCDYFHPIVRDFLLSHGERGLMVLDLNGNIHYTGSAPMYEDAVQPGSIIDRYKKMAYLPRRDSILLLDNRFRLTQAEIDPGGMTARNKIGAMIESGNLITAYNILSTLWRKSSQFTTVCYDMLQTDEIRNMAGHVMYDPSDSIDLYVDMLPVSEDLILLIDRWGRLITENRGSLFLMEGTGLVSWPRTDAIDAALAGDRVYFLCRDGTVWYYAYPDFFGRTLPPFERSPKRWGDLGDFRSGVPWIGIEASADGRELIAVNATGYTVRTGLDDKTLLQTLQLPVEGNALFDFAFKQDESGFSIAYTSREGPASVYTSANEKTATVANTKFGWSVIADIQFSSGGNIILLDRYGVIHQYNPVLQFSEKPYTVIMDAAAFRFLPGGEKALWLRTNGELRRLRVKQ